MAKKEYIGTAYRQALDPEASWLVSFVAPAEEILGWAGIPRRTDNTLTGFQRPDEDVRVARAKDYFSKFSTNQSPTSLVMGVHVQGASSPARLEFLDSNESSSIRSCKLIIEYDEQEDLNVSIDRLRQQIRLRLSEDTSTEEEDLELEIETDSQDTEEEEETIEVDSDEIELGRSLLQRLLEKLDDTEWCASHEKDLRDLSKPATIIDGQHRILGAQRCERGIPFSVIAIFNCSWAEQVFQFTVVNYTAKGIPDQFITANAALSLTAGELQSLESRLEQAGVKVIEYELMRVVNFDPESPFKDLVNLSSKKKATLIGYKTMVQVGKAWYSGKDSAVRQIIEHIYPELPGRSNMRSRLDLWKAEHWALFFKDFWNIVHDTFIDKQTTEGHSLWNVEHSNLMTAVVLFQLQAQFLKNLTAQDETFFEVSGDDPITIMRAKIKKRAQTFIGYFSPDFFARPWKIPSLNTGAGRLALNETFTQIADTKGQYQWTRSTLITGKTQQ